LKPLLFVISAGLVLALGSTSSATAAVPCWKALINDWFDGRIDHVYPTACYRQAIAHLPQDVRSYSSARDDIERAELAAIRYNQEGGGTPSGGTTTTTPSAPGGGNSGSAPPQEESKKGVITRAIEWLGPSNAASVPLPLLILAGVAFLLLAAAGGSFLNRRFRERKPPPPPS
jgi:hypothetical protein